MLRPVSEPFDRDSWERRWEHAVREQPDAVTNRPPNARFLAEVGDLRPGRALDAGCGHGAEAVWLAAAGWQVTAVDFADAALTAARARAAAAGADVAARIRWLRGDLGSWQPPSRQLDLVSCLYVHVAGSVPELVSRLGEGVAPGGTLLLVGHLPVDPTTGRPTAAAGQVQVTVPEALEALDPDTWQVVVAEERSRPDGSGADAVVRAVRLR